MTMARLVPPPIAVLRPALPAMASMDEIAFCAWVAQADPGAALVYHQGFLAVDTDTVLAGLSPEARGALRQLRDAAFRAAEQGLVHLVQQRLATDRFAYIAIARPRRQGAPASLAAQLLDAQAA